MTIKLKYAKMFIALVSIILSCKTYAQLPGFKRLASTGFYTDMARTSSNKYLTISNYGTAQSISCWDSQFNLIWKQTFNISQFQMQKVTQTKDKNIVLMGMASSNLVILKFDTLGNLLFTKRYTNVSGNVSMSTISPAVGNDNGFIVGGGNCIGANFLIKCDANGNVIWSKQFNNIMYSASKNASSIVHSGNDYLVSSNVLTSTVTAIATDAAIMRVDANGNMLWYKQISMPADREEPVRLIRRSNNAFSLLCSTGYTNGTELIYFFDSTLTSVSYKKYINTNNINLLSAEADNSSGLICVGIQSIGTTNKGLLFRTDASGTILWQKLSDMTSSTYNTQLGCLLKTSTNNYAMMAATAFTFTGFGAGVIDVNGNGLCNASNINVTTTNTNPFTVTTPSVMVSSIPIIVTAQTYTNLTTTFDPLVYCGITTGINNAENNPEVSVFPNPSNGILYLEIGNDMDELVANVSNAIGQTVLEKKVDAYQSAISLGDLPDGIYLLTVSNEKGIYFNRKIVLQR